MVHYSRCDHRVGVLGHVPPYGQRNLSDLILWMPRSIAGTHLARRYNASAMGHVAELRRKAELCRRLADISDDADQKARWLERASDWERLAERRKHGRAKPNTNPNMTS